MVDDANEVHLSTMGFESHTCIFLATEFYVPHLSSIPSAYRDIPIKSQMAQSNIELHGEGGTGHQGFNRLISIRSSARHALSARYTTGSASNRKPKF